MLMGNQCSGWGLTSGPGVGESTWGRLDSLPGWAGKRLQCTGMFCLREPCPLVPSLWYKSLAIPHLERT